MQAEAQRLARAWDAAHPREPYVLFLLNRPPPLAQAADPVGFEQAAVPDG